MAHICLRAPAKVNLFLEITGKRPDGYHDLATLFAKTSLADILTLDAEPAQQEELSLVLDGPHSGGLSAEQDNLALRAVRIFEKHFNMTLRVHIRLTKNIPFGAGLGGGSSDAGTVLLGLCHLFGKPPQELLSDAARLGADVPLFLYPDTFLKGEGIGERLTPIPLHTPSFWAVLAYPDEAVPTKGVFQRLRLPDRQSVLTRLSNLDKLIQCLCQGLPPTQWQNLLFNRLEEAVLPYIGSVRKTKEDFSALGAVPLMSGSGSTVFAVTPDRQLAEDLAGRIKQKGRKVFTVRFGGNQDENN